MTMCIFCKIINEEIPADIVFENEDVIAFKDIHPIAPVHMLIIPKKHVANMNNTNSEDALLLGKMLIAAVEIAKRENIAEDGYKLLIRTGEHGGQEVEHIHLHLIGGAPLFEEIRPK